MAIPTPTHVRPYAAGGESTADNIQLRCRAHNGYEAERYFGRRTPSVVREPGGSYSVPSRAAAPGGCGPVTRSGPSDGLGRSAALDFSGAEDQLSGWMDDNLEVGVCAVADYEALES